MMCTFVILIPVASGREEGYHGLTYPANAILPSERSSQGLEINIPVPFNIFQVQGWEGCKEVGTKVVKVAKKLGLH